MSDPFARPVSMLVLVTGRVQGVNYRAACARRARSLGVAGTVRNLPDGRVELTAIGPAASVDRLIEWCHHGPDAARVDGVEVRDAERPAVGGFVIIE